MNRNEMNEAIRVATSKNWEFEQEILHFMSIEDREYEYDEVCALFDAMDMEGQTRGVINKCRDLLIQFGFYRVMPQEEIDNTYVSSGSKWHFKKAGIAYTSDETQDEWFDTKFRE